MPGKNSSIRSFNHSLKFTSRSDLNSTADLSYLNCVLSACSVQSLRNSSFETGVKTRCHI